MSKGLLESIETDIEESGLTPEEIEALGIAMPTTDEDEDYDEDAARERIEQRKQQRADGGNDAKPPRDDGGASRGTGGDASGDSKTSSKNGEVSQVKDGDEPEPTSPAGWAKARRELREAKAAASRTTALETELAALKATKPAAAELPVIKTTDTKTTTRPKSLAELGQEPDRNEDLAGWLVYQAEAQRIRDEQRDRESQTTMLARDAAEKITAEQSEYRETNPDYDNALNHAKKEFTSAFKRLNPRATEPEIRKALALEVVQTAYQCERDGASLGEALYDMAIERFGYEPQDHTNPNPNPSGKVPPAAPRQPKVDLKVVANNKRRSASAMEGGGQRTAPRLTVEQKANMSLNELMQLPAEEWDNI